MRMLYCTVLFTQAELEKQSHSVRYDRPDNLFSCDNHGFPKTE